MEWSGEHNHAPLGREDWSLRHYLMIKTAEEDEREHTHAVGVCLTQNGASACYLKSGEGQGGDYDNSQTGQGQGGQNANRGVVHTEGDDACNNLSSGIGHGDDLLTDQNLALEEVLRTYLGGETSTPIRHEVNNTILGNFEEMGFPSRVRNSVYFDEESTYMSKGVFKCNNGHGNGCLFQFTVRGTFTNKYGTSLQVAGNFDVP